MPITIEPMTAHPLRRLRLARGLPRQGWPSRRAARQRRCSSLSVGGHVPSPLVRQRLAAALGVDVREIWPGEETFA
jgi:lambda repressor-like predicted transcriptional regulator